MDIIKLIGVFFVILLLIRLKKPLYAAMLSGVAAVIILYGIKFSALPLLFWKGATGTATINLVLSFYSITFLQRMMEKRKRLLQAEIAIHKTSGEDIEENIKAFLEDKLESLNEIHAGFHRK